MIDKLYQYILQLCRGPRGQMIMSIVSFTEAVVFIIPPDPFLGLLCIKKTYKRIIKLVFLCLICSVAGGCLGYYLGEEIVAFGIKNDIALISNNIDKIQSINILDNRINIDTNSNDGIGGGYTIKLSKYPLIDKSITIDNFLSLITNTDSNIQFQRTNGLFFDIESDNVIIRCDNINLSIQILDNIKQYNNLILRKIQYTKTDSSVHLYITALRS